MRTKLIAGLLAAAVAVPEMAADHPDRQEEEAEACAEGRRR